MKANLLLVTEVVATVIDLFKSDCSACGFYNNESICFPSASLTEINLVPNYSTVVAKQRKMVQQALIDTNHSSLPAL